MVMYLFPRRTILFSVCLCSLMNILGYLYYVHPRYLYSARKPQNCSTSPKLGPRELPSDTTGYYSDEGEFSASKNGVKIQEQRSLLRNVTFTKVTEPSTRRPEKSTLQPGLLELFQNFSLSFGDLKTGFKPPINNENITYQKFVFTRKQKLISPGDSEAPAHSPTTTPSPAPQYINPHPYNFTINEEGVCSSNSSAILAVIVVCSGLGNSQSRTAIRETWGSGGYLARWGARIVFLVGATNDTQLQQLVLTESRQFHDIVQENFLDTYRNLSLKSVAMLKWVRTHCRNAKFVLKADDDMFINVQMLHKILSKTAPNRTIIGAVIIGAKPVQVKTSKWYTPKEEYSERFYPKYCSGTSYVISADLVPDLYHTTLNTRLFWLEDIYITGICARKLHPRYVSHSGFTFNKRPSTGCAFQNAISGHQVKPQEMRTIWKQIDTKNCPKPKKSGKSSKSKSRKP